MSVFNYIDTFFFISLGITFVLLLLLVFHFKSRLVVLEEKTDTIFEIVNNMVQELNNMKRFHYSSHPQACSIETIQTLYDNKTLNMNTSGKILISDDEGDYESDDDDDESDSDSSSDRDSEYDINENLDGLEVNIINDKEELIIESTELHDEVVPSEIKMVEINISEPITDIDIEKVDHDITTSIEEDSAQQCEIENKDIHTMTLPELRKLASSRGITNNLSKLKKGELIQILEKESL